MHAPASPRRARRRMQRTRGLVAAISLTTAEVPSGESSSTKITSHGISDSAAASRLMRIGTFSLSLKVGTTTLSSSPGDPTGTATLVEQKSILSATSELMLHDTPQRPARDARLWLMAGQVHPAVSRSPLEAGFVTLNLVLQRKSTDSRCLRLARFIPFGTSPETRNAEGLEPATGVARRTRRCRILSELARFGALS